MSVSDSPPLPPAAAASPPAPARSGLASLLSLVLLLFLVSGAAAFLDESLVLFAHRTDTSIVAGLLCLLMLFVGCVGCVLTAFIPAIPKRYFLPVSLYIPVAYIAILPLFVYFHRQSHWITWGAALGQFLLGIYIVRRLHRGGAPAGERSPWPLVLASQIPNRRFSVGNLAAVVFGGAFLLLPALILYTGFCAQLAVSHFTDGFVSLRTSGIVMQVRKYTRDDGCKITLVPMSHIGAPSFYHDLSASFPPDAVILMEGVSDTGKLLDSHINYSRMATATGGVQQIEAFKPPGTIVPADVDVSAFSPATLDLLKKAMLVHAKGLTPETLPLLSQPTPPGLEQQLIDDLLIARNRHVLEVLQAHLATSPDIIIPWGAAHMPGISAEIKKLGFHLIGSQDFTAIKFGRQ